MTRWVLLVILLTHTIPLFSSEPDASEFDTLIAEMRAKVANMDMQYEWTAFDMGTAQFIYSFRNQCDHTDDVAKIANLGEAIAQGSYSSMLEMLEDGDEEVQTFGNTNGSEITTTRRAILEVALRNEAHSTFMYLSGKYAPKDWITDCPSLHDMAKSLVQKQMFLQSFDD